MWFFSLSNNNGSQSVSTHTNMLTCLTEMFWNRLDFYIIQKNVLIHM